HLAQGRVGHLAVAATLAVVDLPVAVLVVVHAVARPGGVEAEDGVELVVEAVVGDRRGGDVRATEADDRGEGGRDRIDDVYLDLARPVRGRDRDLRGGVVLSGLGYGRSGAPEDPEVAQAAVVDRRIVEGQQRVPDGLAPGLGGVATEQIRGGWDQLLGAGQSTRVSGILDIPALEVETSGVQPEGNDPEEDCSRERDDDEALSAL